MLTDSGQSEARQFPVALVSGLTLWRVVSACSGSLTRAVPRYVSRSNQSWHCRLKRGASHMSGSWSGPFANCGSVLYPGGSYPKTKRLVDSLTQVKTLWDKWPSPGDWQAMTERPQLWHVLSLDLSELESKRSRIDAQIKLTVTAPLSERFLPTPALASWGVRSAPAFNLLLLCAGAWCEGVEVYESDVGEYCHPTSLTTKSRPTEVSRSPCVGRAGRCWVAGREGWDSGKRHSLLRQR